LDVETNWAIVESFKNKLCSSTTIIANGEAFVEAVCLAREYNLQNRIGLHVNLVEFNPLTPIYKENSLFCTSYGVFHKDWRVRNKSGIKIDNMTKKLVVEEIAAQIDRCLNSGIKPTHIDSHSHVHTIPGISQIVCAVAKQYCINKIRISRNCGLIGLPFYKKAYKILYNNWLRFTGFKTTDFFGSIDDVILLQKKYPDIMKKKKVEIMCHPRKRGNDIVDLNGISLKEQIEKIDGYNMAVSFNALLQG
jgi:predicted glycoside hydrolase/deacetylase ChbG (UPF0249 family)